MPGRARLDAPGTLHHIIIRGIDELQIFKVKALSQYPWSGHGVLIGQFKNDWQDVDYVLKLFAPGRRRARQVYKRFVEEG
ncbi:MAG: hypothetical protein ACUVWV_04920 [Thermodesulfobacteriota bacterium]